MRFRPETFDLLPQTIAPNVTRRAVVFYLSSSGSVNFLCWFLCVVNLSSVLSFAVLHVRPGRWERGAEPRRRDLLSAGLIHLYVFTMCCIAAQLQIGCWMISKSTIGYVLQTSRVSSGRREWIPRPHFRRDGYDRRLRWPNVRAQPVSCSKLEIRMELY